MKTGLQFATYKEAVPFLNNEAFAAIAEKPFPLYRKNNLYIIISGIGKVNSAIAASYAISEYKTERMINLGSAGSLVENYAVGDILHINKSLEYDSRSVKNPRHKYLIPDIIEGIPSASLVTGDSPVISLEERKRISEFGTLVDMEGASFLQACRAFNSESYLFKVVSDTPGNSDLNEIIQNIKKTREVLYRYIIENMKDFIQL
jgi:adenosylhomocysteine nucleosidase